MSQQRKHEAGSVTRLPAHDIEALVLEKVGEMIGAESELQDVWPKLEIGKQSDLLRVVTKSVMVGQSQVLIKMLKSRLRAVCEQRLWESDATEDANLEEAGEDEVLEITVPVTIKKNGSEKVIILPGAAVNDDEQSPHAAMITAIVKAHDWVAKLKSGEVKSVNELSQKFNMNRRYIARLLRLAFLAPDIIESILDGTQPRSLSLYDLIKPMPVNWDGQRKALGFAAL